MSVRSRPGRCSTERDDEVQRLVGQPINEGAERAVALVLESRDVPRVRNTVGRSGKSSSHARHALVAGLVERRWAGWRASALRRCRRVPRDSSGKTGSRELPIKHRQLRSGGSPCCSRTAASPSASKDRRSSLNPVARTSHRVGYAYALAMQPPNSAVSRTISLASQNGDNLKEILRHDGGLGRPDTPQREHRLLTAT